MKFLIIFLVSFISSTIAISVSCENSLQSWSHLDDDIVTCNAKVNEYDNRNITTVPDDDNLKVQMFKVSNNSMLTFIPQKISTFLPNFIAIYLSSCGISKIQSGDLSEYKNLQWLSLSNNQIEHIPKDFFASTPDIRAIYFYGNKIKSVAANLLNPISNLIFANFKDNDCINQFTSNIEDLISNLAAKCEDLSQNIIDNNELPELTCGEGSVKDRICYLEIQIEILSRKNDAINLKLDEIISKLHEMDDGILGLNFVQQFMHFSSEMLNQDEYEEDESIDDAEIFEEKLKILND